MENSKFSAITRKLLQQIGRLIAFILFFLAIGLPIFFGVYYQSDIAIGNQYFLFGQFISFQTIFIVLIVLLMPIGAYGFIAILKATVNMLRKKESKVSKLAKGGAVYILLLIMIVYMFYSPFWYIYLGYTPNFGPYIALHGDDGMQVTWSTNKPTDTMVYYGLDPNTLTTPAYGGEWWFENNTKESLYHSVAITGLLPNTKYYYTVPTLGDEIYSFTTAPLPNSGEPVRFTILGDTQGNYDIQRLNIALMTLNSNPNFTMIVGDTCNQDDDIPEWAMLMDDQSYGKIAPYVPWMATSGNHETSSEDADHPMRENFKHRFQNVYTTPESLIPAEGMRDMGIYYSFNYSNVHMVILDNFDNGLETFSEAQMTWLQADLARNEDNWKFLSFHYSMYSDSDHGSYPELAMQLEPILAEYNVDAVFYGHDHIFESYQINHTQYQDGTMIFMCAGGGGSLKQVTNVEKMGERVWDINSGGISLNEYNNIVMIGNETDGRFNTTESYGHEHQLYAERCFHYMDVQVDGETAIYNAYRTYDGSLMASYTRARKA